MGIRGGCKAGTVDRAAMRFKRVLRRLQAAQKKKPVASTG